MSKLEITVVVDSNDGDYMSAINEISEETLDKLRPLITAIKNFECYTTNHRGLKWTHYSNFATGECCRTDLGELPVEELYADYADVIELFMDYCPWGEWGFHTIERIEVCPKQNKERLL
jgi:hypothetical protein